MTGYELLEAAHKSMIELRTLGREPVLIRMHPLDAETIIAMKQPQNALKRLTRLFDLEVVLDNGARMGEPVAEFEEGAR